MMHVPHVFLFRQLHEQIKYDLFCSSGTLCLHTFQTHPSYRLFHTTKRGRHFDESLHSDHEQPWSLNSWRRSVITNAVFKYLPGGRGDNKLNNRIIGKSRKGEKKRANYSMWKLAHSRKYLVWALNDWQPAWWKSRCVTFQSADWNMLWSRSNVKVSRSKWLQLLNGYSLRDSCNASWKAWQFLQTWKSPKIWRCEVIFSEICWYNIHTHWDARRPTRSNTLLWRKIQANRPISDETWDFQIKSWDDL